MLKNEQQECMHEWDNARALKQLNKNFSDDVFGRGLHNQVHRTRVYKSGYSV